MKIAIFATLILTSMLAHAQLACPDLFTERPKAVSTAAGPTEPVKPRLNARAFETAKARTKKQFVGLDATIDTIFAQIKSWALAPETRKIPTVIFMPGMTGTGKTALIRTIVQQLDLARDFYYYDMEGFSGTDMNFKTDIAGAITNSLSEREMQSVLKLPVLRRPSNPIFMFDEFQKINTINPANGQPVPRPNAQAIFELLGNMGKLKVTNPRYETLRRMMENPDSYLPIPDEVKYGSTDKEKKTKALEEMYLVARKAFEKEPMTEILDLSNSLIFIGANLDDVYSSSRTSDPESLTADELNRSTSLVRPSDIRGGLLRMFRPEHVGRLGSRYVSFATLPAKAFATFINVTLADIKKTALKNYGLDLRFSKTFVRRIYEEGVIPTQGMRPLLQSINTFALDPLADVYARAKSAGHKAQRDTLIVDVDTTQAAETSTWTFRDGKLAGTKATYEVPSENANALKLRPEPFRSQVAVRVAAKVTLAAAIGRGLPTRVKANSRMTGKDGVVSFDRADAKPELVSLERSYLFRDQMIAEVAYNLAPYAAETMIYGQVSQAGAADLQAATAVAYAMAGSLGMTAKTSDGSPLTSVPITQNRVDFLPDIERVLQEALELATAKLGEERGFFAAVAGSLTRKVELDQNEIQTMYKESWSSQEARHFDASVNPAADFISAPSAFAFKDAEKPHKNPMGF